MSETDDLAVTISVPGSDLPPVETTVSGLEHAASRARNLTLLDRPNPSGYEPPEGVDLSDLYPPDKREFGGAEFLPADALDDLLTVLVARHEHFMRFWPFVRVRCLWKAQGGASGGKATLGKAVKVSGLARYLTQLDAVLWLAADELFVRSFTPYQIEALLFHELCHIGWDAKSGLYIRPHSFELYRADLEHYGAWDVDLEDLVATVQQLEFDEEDGDE